jgi:hypothetical protein
MTTTTPKPEAIEAFTEVVRGVCRCLGVEVAAAILGAATSRLMGRKPEAKPPTAWNLDKNGDPTDREEAELEALCHRAEQHFFAFMEGRADAEVRSFSEAVQKGAQLALTDLGYRVEITRNH